MLFLITAGFLFLTIISGAVIDEELISTNTFAAGLKTSLYPNPIPYKIGDALNPKIVSAVKAAIAELEEKTCLRFVERRNETGYMSFQKGIRCYAAIGYISKYARPVLLSRAQCRTKGWILHHIMHALGFMLESNRPDRNQYLKVVWDNIPEADRKYFERRDAYSSLADYHRIPYDYDSITHPSRYYKGNYSVTLLTLDYYKRYKIGQRKGLSELDVLSVNLLYKCPGTTRPPATIPPIVTDAPQKELKPYLQEKNICGHLTDDIHCPYGHHIWIENAMYGRENPKVCTYGRGLYNNCSSNGTYDIVRKKCHGKMECRLHAYNRIFGDECHGTYKYLSVKYRCVKTDTMCYTAAKNISCPPGQVLKIFHATYGRMSKYICPTSYMKNVYCESPKSLEITKKLCDGKSSCKVFSSSKIYGDPCAGTIKYLQVTSQCVLPEI